MLLMLIFCRRKTSRRSSSKDKDRKKSRERSKSKDAKSGVKVKRDYDAEEQGTRKPCDHLT